MNVRRFLNFVALIVFAINIFFIGFFRGCALATPLPSYVYGETVSEGLIFSYIYINALIIIFFLIKMIKEQVITNILCIFVMLFTFYPYRHIYLQKSIFFNKELQIRQIYTDALLLDWIGFSLVLILLIFQIITAFQLYFDWKRNNAEVK